MSRKNNDTYKCVICGEDAFREVVCYGCTMKEQARQKLEPGSITEAQIYFIEKKLMHLTTEETAEIFREVVPDYEHDIDTLSCKQGKDLAAKILDKIENKAQPVSEVV